MQFPLPPRTLLQNRYLIVRQIGQGGMGAVYEAKDQRLGHRVALKQSIVSGPEVERAFKREARTLATLRHAALPAVSDYFIEENHQFLVMQYIPGDDLQTLLQRQGHPFEVRQLLDWADQLLDALEFLHSQSPPIIHRDIKPENIKLSVRGEVILLDFGISKGGGSNNTRLSMSGASIAAFTPNYAPLEQIEGHGTNERSDLYSLGVTLHHLLTGVLPPTAITRATAPIYANPDPLRPANELNSQVPAALATLLTQATALNQTQRPHSAFAMRAMLKAASAPAAPKEVPFYEPETPVFPKWPNTPPPPAEYPTPAPAPPTEKLSTAPLVLKTDKELYKESFSGCFNTVLSLMIVIVLPVNFLIEFWNLYESGNLLFATLGLLFAFALAYGLGTEEKKYKYFNKIVLFIKNDKLAISKGGTSIYNSKTLEQENKLINLTLLETNDLDLSPDGITLACAVGHKIELWNVVSGVLRSTLTLEHSLVTVNSVAFSPDGARVASALDNKTIRLWDIDSGTVRITLEGHRRAVKSVAFSPDGLTLASASDDKTIKLWDVATENLRAILKEHSERINSIAFSPDGTLLASASDDKSIKLWHMPSGTLRTTLRGHTMKVNCVTFSPNGILLASASDDNTAKLWDVASGILRANLLDHTKKVTSVAFSPDGQTLASTSKDKSVRFWDLSPLD